MRGSKRRMTLAARRESVIPSSLTALAIERCFSSESLAVLSAARIENKPSSTRAMTSGTASWATRCTRVSMTVLVPHEAAMKRQGPSTNHGLPLEDSRPA